MMSSTETDVAPPVPVEVEVVVVVPVDEPDGSSPSEQPRSRVGKKERVRPSVNRRAVRRMAAS
jgi:hypothetical protein